VVIILIPPATEIDISPRRRSPRDTLSEQKRTWGWVYVLDFRYK
jgi:hypothetical protein